MNVVLVFFKPDGQRRDLPITRPTTVLGRGAECSMRIPVSQVSRQHCELSQNNGSIKLKDLGSSNGTYVNGKRVLESKIKAGDRVQIGPVMFTVQIDGKPSSIEPALSSPSEASSAHDTTRTISPDEITPAPKPVKADADTPPQPLVLEESPLEEISDGDMFAADAGTSADAAGSDDSFAALLQEFSSPDDLDGGPK